MLAKELLDQQIEALNTDAEYHTENLNPHNLNILGVTYVIMVRMIQQLHVLTHECMLDYLDMIL